MNKISNIFIIILAVVLGSSCSDIFEKDLAKQSMVLLGPADSTETYTLNQNFWWAEVKGADQYNLQIVSPSFAAPMQWHLDSNTVDTKYPFTLSAGTYEWRARAENNSSSTEYVVSSLVVLLDSTADLANQIMVLQGPTNGSATNEMTLVFTWDTLAYADDYTFEIVTPDFATGTKESQIVTEGSASYTFTQEGDFQWRVRAQNDVSFVLSESFSLEVDTTAPDTPINLEPFDGASAVDSAITFTWTQSSNIGSAIYDSIFIYTDSSFISSSLKLKQQLASASFTDSLGGPETYYWYVGTYDAAGNESEYSFYNELIIQ
jgi:hypothetical protein